jgi:hypothetical protein
MLVVLTEVIEWLIDQLLCRITSGVLGLLTEVTEWLIDQLLCRTTSSVLGVLTEVTEWLIDHNQHKIIITDENHNT